MKNDTWIGKKGFRYFYYRFRDSEYYGLSIIGFILLACIILLFTIIIPEVTQWFSIRNEVIATQERIATLQQNINLINSLDKNALNSQLQTVSHALPPEKNIGYMLNALSNAAANAGIALNDYSFQLGNIAAPSKGSVNGAGPNGLSTIQIIVTVNGSVDGIKRFIASLENNLPISEVTGIDGTGENVSVRMQFYQEPFPKVAYSEDMPLENLSPQKTELLQTLSKWDNTTIGQNAAPPSSSNSAVPLF